MQDGGEEVNVEIEGDEAVVGYPDDVTMYGGADADTISSRGFMARGAKHSEMNDSGKSKGIPFHSDESKMIHSTVITNEGHKAGTKSAKTKDNPKGHASKVPVEKILKAFEAAESNPNDVFRNNKIAMNFMDERLAYQEQKSNEGKFLKGLRDELKKKDPELFARVMEYVIQNNPNDAQQVMQGAGAGMPQAPPAEMPEGMGGPQEMMASMGQPGMEGQPPMMRNGGRNFSSGANYKKWLAYGHASGEFAKTPGHQKVSIKGKPKRVKHQDSGNTPATGLTGWAQELWDRKVMRDNLEKAKKVATLDNWQRRIEGEDIDFDNDMEREVFDSMDRDRQRGVNTFMSEQPISKTLSRYFYPGTIEHTEYKMRPALLKDKQLRTQKALYRNQAEEMKQRGQLPVTRWSRQFGGPTRGAAPMDPSLMNNQQRHNFNMRNNLYQMGGMTGGMDPMAMQGMMGAPGSSLPPELQAAQGMGMSPEDELAMAQDPAMAGMMGGEGEQVDTSMAQQVMQALPNVLKSFTPEELAQNPDDIFQPGFEKELQQMGMDGAQIKAINIDELGTGQIGEILGQMVQDASPEGKDPGAMEAGMEQQMPMGPEGMMPEGDMMGGEVPPEMMQAQAMEEVQQMMAYSGRTDQGFPDYKFQPTTWANNNWRPTFQYGGRLMGQTSLKTPGDMDISMAKQRAEENVSWMPSFLVENIDPGSFKDAVQGVETKPYEGFESRFRRDEFDIPAPQAEAPEERELDSRPDYKTQGKTYQTLAEEAGKLQSGRSKALHENVAETLEGLFKGTKYPGKEGSAGIMTEEGREYFRGLGMTDAEMDALTYENLPQSEAWGKFIGPEMEKKYKTLRNKGDSFQSMNKLRSTNFENTGHATLALVEEALKNDRILDSDFGKDVVEPIMDLLASDAGQGITLDMVKTNPEKVLKMFGDVMSRGTKFGSYKAAVDKYGSGVEQSKSKESLKGVKTETKKGHVPLETESDDLGKPGKGMSFSQAFRYAKEKQMPKFKWNGRVYLGKTTSEATPAEVEAMKKAKGRYQGPPPSGDFTPGLPGVVPDYTRKPGSPGANFAKRAAGEAVTQQPVAGKPKKYTGGFDYEHTERELVPLGRDNKATGGRTLSNGQYIEFQMGGRTMSGYVDKYDPISGDFELRQRPY
jgi:hypothetical protein